MAVDCVGQTVDHLHQMFQFSSGHDFNLSRAVKRTGHARFRRAPAVFSDGPSTSSSQSEDVKTQKVTVTATESASPSTSSSSNGKSLGILAPAPTFSSRKPPLPSTHRKRCNTDVNRSGSVSRSGCHCCKRRKMSSSSKRLIRRVPIIGSKITSIPADDYSWKKYGEKKIDGSVYPRVYYKCNTGKGCPARKRVELSLDDSKMLIVTYDGEHRHHHAPTPTPTPVPMSLTGVVV